MHLTMPRILSTLAATLLAGCGNAPSSAETGPSQPPTATDAPQPDTNHAAWGYLGAGAPSQWAKLDPEFAKCATGQFQSPIDLHPIAKADVDMLAVDYRPDVLRIVNNGHTVQVNHDAGSTLKIGDHAFDLLQYHLHSPSEHEENGERHALELHLVHQDEAGNYAVVGVFIDEGSSDHTDDGLWRHLPKVVDGEHVFDGEKVDPTHFLPPTLTHYQYHGSLTTPPCTETVTWNVLDTPIMMSAEHIARFRELYGANARPVQPRADWCLEPHVIGEPE